MRPTPSIVTLSQRLMIVNFRVSSLLPCLAMVLKAPVADDHVCPLRTAARTPCTGKNFSFDAR
jgi:hypothetical protein